MSQFVRQFLLTIIIFYCYHCRGKSILIQICLLILRYLWLFFLSEIYGLFVSSPSSSSSSSQTLSQQSSSSLNYNRGRTFFTSPFLNSLMTRKQCPLCDSSVYSYCGDKLFHDSCCCSNINNPYGKCV